MPFHAMIYLGHSQVEPGTRAVRRLPHRPERRFQGHRQAAVGCGTAELSRCALAADRFESGVPGRVSVEHPAGWRVMGRLIRVGRRLVGLKAASRRPLQTTHDGTPEGVPLQSPSPLSSSVAYDGSVQKPRFYAGLKACSTLRVRRSLLILILALTQITTLPAMAQEDSDTESWFSLTSQKTFLSGEKPEICRQRAQREAAGVPRLSRERSGEVFQPDAGAAQLRRAGPGSAQAGAHLAGKVSRLEAPHLGMDPRLRSRTVLARLAPRRFACGRWAAASRRQGPEGRQLRAGSGAESAAGRLGVEVDGSRA